MIETENDILYVNFNQDAKCFSVGTQTGFKIYSTNNHKLSLKRDMGGGIGIVEMLYRCNVLALVGGGKNPKFLLNKVIIWDDFAQKQICELKFSTSVKAVKLKKAMIFVICDQKIYVFSFETFQNLDKFDTYDNPRGIIAINNIPEKTLIAFPDKIKGNVRLKCYEKSTNEVIRAHESQISFLTMNNEGTLLATASDRGTLIRIFSTATREFLQEVRRGKDKADIHFVCFEIESKFIAATSDKETIHIWSLANCLKKLKEEKVTKGEDMNEFKSIEEGEIVDLPKNHKSIFQKLPNFLAGGFFQSEWSFAQVRIPEPNCICAFGQNNSFFIINTKGHYYKANIDIKKGEECAIEEKYDMTLDDKK